MLPIQAVPSGAFLSRNEVRRHVRGTKIKEEGKTLTYPLSVYPSRWLDSSTQEMCWHELHN